MVLGVGSQSLDYLVLFLELLLCRLNTGVGGQLGLDVFNNLIETVRARHIVVEICLDLSVKPVVLPGAFLSTVLAASWSRCWFSKRMMRAWASSCVLSTRSLAGCDYLCRLSFLVLREISARSPSSSMSFRNALKEIAFFCLAPQCRSRRRSPDSGSQLRTIHQIGFEGRLLVS